jgi:chemotaxis protein MotB
MADPKKDEKDDKKKAPIIIKKIKKGGHGHHGGAWKVAYADFVTAMMAFFLLLWLLSSTPQEKLQALSDYFQPTVGIRDAKGIGFAGGSDSNDDKDNAKEKSSPPPSVIFGASKSGPMVKVEEDEQVEDQEDEEQKLIKVQDQIKENLSNSADLRDYKDQIKIDITPEGLRIQIIDSAKRPMFKEGGAVMEEHMKKILKGLSAFLKSVPNYISVTGHTDSKGGGNPGYTNFEISGDRANVTRRFMVESTFPKERVAWTTGKADREPLVPENPDDPTNRRISIMLLKRAVLPKHLQTAPEKLFLENHSIKDDSMMKLDGTDK